MNQSPSPKQNNVQVRYTRAPEKTINPARRYGRIALVVVWFLILLLPLFFIIMVTQGQVVIPLGDAPEHELRVWLVSEVRLRGFGINTASQASRSDTSVCVQHDLRFLLWMGEQEPSQYCECFTRADSGSSWSFSSGEQGACPA